MLYRILTKLGQNDQWVSGYKSYQQFDLKGHVGVTGVKKVIFTENATPPTHYIAGARDSCILTILTSSTNLITLQVSLGSFGVTGVKKQGQITNNFKCQK